MLSHKSGLMLLFARWPRMKTRHVWVAHSDVNTWFSSLSVTDHSPFCLRSADVKTIPSQRDVTAISQSTLATPFVWRLVRWKMGKGTSRVLAVTAEHACTYLPYAMQTYLLLFVFLLIFVSSEFIIAVQTFSKKFTGVRQGSFAVLSWQFS